MTFQKTSLKYISAVLGVTILVLILPSCTKFISLNRVIDAVPIETEHQHSWLDATCSAPKTCTGCGETEGKALKHDWEDADCENPRTCSLCGETDGDDLGHTMTTYSSFCTECGEFEYYNLRAVRLAVEDVASIYDELIKDGTIDSYRILRVYYVETANCQCKECYQSEEDNDPYLTTFILAEYKYKGEKYKIVDWIGAHKFHEKGTDKYYRFALYTSDSWYNYNNDQLTKVYAQDYSYYYERDDLIEVDIGKLLSNK